MIIGFISVMDDLKINIEIIKSNKNFLILFFNYFTNNFWYLFIIWIIGLFPICFIFDYLIIFIKGIILGITISIFLKADGIPSIINIIKIYYQELLFIIPSFIYLSYHAVIYSFGGSYQFNYQDKDAYLNKLYKVIFVLLISCVLFAVTKQTIKIY